MNKKLSVLGAAALAFSVNAEAAFVDLFTEVGFVEDNTADSTAVTATQNNIASIIGGFRDISVSLITDTNPGPNNAVSLDINSGVLNFSNDNGSGGEGLVQWNGQAGVQDLSVAGGFGLGLNAYDLGSKFSYTVLSLDLTQFDFTIEAYTDENTFTRVRLVTTSPGTEVINFADLENAALCGTSFGPILSVECGSSGNVNMSNLGALQSRLNINGAQVAVDLSIGPITTVPEPSVIGLVGMGLLAAGFAGKRRSNQGAFQA
jgi:hypothetical protein